MAKLQSTSIEKMYQWIFFLSQHNGVRRSSDLDEVGFIIDFLIGAVVKKAHRCPLAPFVLDRDEVVPSRTRRDDLCSRGRKRIFLILELQKLSID